MPKSGRQRIRFRPVGAARDAIQDARELRSESQAWTKNRSRLEAQLKALQGLVFWNTLERNKVARTVPLQLVLLGGYVVASTALDTFAGTEVGILLFGFLVWYALEVVNSTFEYLLDELHGRHFDERHARIKDMGAGASSLVAFALVIAAVAFCF